ncbi:serine protease [Pendulispora brunnea]|uniref:Serine protease n=1 Tax=Pendulispora brunnea TaxID=2905690 RepID=A0ABZ2KQN7_9BACT
MMTNIPSERDLIDARIDVHAQRALRRLFGGDIDAREDAREMLSAVKAGTLAGIYIVNQRVPALRLQKLGTGWWQAIPPNRDAVVVLDPANLATGAPLIAFRDSVKANASRLDPALREAWTIARRFGRGEFARCDLDSGLSTESTTRAPQRRVKGTIPGLCEPRKVDPCKNPTTPSRTCSRHDPYPEDRVVRPWICRLEVTFRWSVAGLRPRWEQRTDRGTGILVSPRHVLTAAHGLFVRAGHYDNPKNEEPVLAKADDIRIYPGDDDRRPVEALTAAKLRVSAAWNRSIASAAGPPPAADYGLITLEKPVPRSAAPRWQFAGLPLLPSSPVRTGGYTDECCFDGRCAGRQTYRTGVVLGGDVLPIVRLELPSAHGHSGSPVWTMEKDQAVLRGVLVRKLERNCSQALDLTPGLWKEVSTWIQADNGARRAITSFAQSTAANYRRR